ncbi:PREDICTED: globin [Dinoponera quadriceps]|uniref:Globin n=1 Tax=Dinoponera quadriceps TaxID=609295 RepID=A0A6P3XGW9_DINQU|nr:PREDICTED: globin [Dinoponera quadriceps]XP_014477682.1 PREDICTED: globin [Dinoponera quadriceps]XP_014477683.1 PREDICTED: globin [Dinoponera quadriceps]XP_014477684.1 PREDICTED: globin [Dinoponera quadriceps]
MLTRLYKYFTEGRDDLDERIGMTEKQKKLVQNTWAIIRKDEVSSGIAVMSALFTRHPEYQNEFKLFKGIPFDELSKNKRFQAHCANIIGTLSGTIDHIHDPELMEAGLLTLAERHKARGQTREQFQNLRHVLEDLYPSVFGKQYTPEVQEAWKKMFDYMFPIFYRVFNG